jgi:hypothetical protein
MPRKQQPTHKDKRAGKSKANLGQTEAELEKIGKEQMSHNGRWQSQQNRSEAIH